MKFVEAFKIFALATNIASCKFSKQKHSSMRIIFFPAYSSFGITVLLQ